MEDFRTFTYNIEISAKKILKNHAKKIQQETQRENVNKKKLHKKENNNNLHHHQIDERSILNESKNSLESPKKLKLKLHHLPPLDNNNKLNTNHFIKDKELNNPFENNYERKKHLKMITNSPLYKSLERSQSETILQLPKNQLSEIDKLKQFLLYRNNHSLTSNDKIFRADHALEKRLCHACWSQPSKITRCEHGLHSISSNLYHLNESNKAPRSWSSEDIWLMYRSDIEREKKWEELEKYNKEIENKIEKDKDNNNNQSIKVIERHPIYDKFYNQLQEENKMVLIETKKRNTMKSFILSVDKVWLKNLDSMDFTDDPTIHSTKGLKNRRDMAAIRRGETQIQSVSLDRSLVYTKIKKIDSHDNKGNLEDMASSKNLEKSTESSIDSYNEKKITDNFLSLSMEVCGRKNTYGKVPGIFPIGNRSFFEKFPLDTIEYTQAVAMCYRNKKLSFCNNIIVSIVLALDVPFVSPLCMAWIDGSIVPKKELDGSFVFLMPKVYSIHNMIISCPLISNLNDRLPPTICILNKYSILNDYQGTKDTSLEKGHRRFWTDKNEFAFQQKITICSIEPNYENIAISFGITEKSAKPNKPEINARYCWHSDEVTTKEFIVPFNQRDFLYIISKLSTTSSGSNDPLFFTIYISHEAMKEVITNSLSSTISLEKIKKGKEMQMKQLKELQDKIEMGKMALEAKRMEKERIDKVIIENNANKKREKEGIDNNIKDLVIIEWEERMNDSIIMKETDNWEERKHMPTDSIFYCNKNIGIIEKYQWNCPENWDELLNIKDKDLKIYGKLEEKDKSKDQIPISLSFEEIMKNLAENEAFLELLKEKLNLKSKDQDRNEPENVNGTEFKSLDKTNDNSRIGKIEKNDMIWENSNNDEMNEIIDHLEKTEHHSHKRGNIINISNEKTNNMKNKFSSPGEKWKNIKNGSMQNEFAKNFYFTKTEGSKESLINQTNIPFAVGIIKRKNDDDLQLELAPELKSLIISDITADMERMIELSNSSISKDISSSYNTKDTIDPNFKDNSINKNIDQAKKMVENVAKAIIYTRNGNITELENIFDEGVDVNTRDDNGNTLFLIACQQGNKRIAKFLLRRSCDINAKNINGNTALHYCFEYKNEQLANYLIEKGADTSITNIYGLTCYEGISEEKLANL